MQKKEFYVKICLQKNSPMLRIGLKFILITINQLIDFVVESDGAADIAISRLPWFYIMLKII